MEARTYKSAGSRCRMFRTAKIGAAGDAIGALEPGMELYVLTFGQFSLIDAICHVVEQTGPADVDISTWTAAHADLTRASALLEQSAIRRMRWLVDRSFPARQPSFTERMVELFGEEAIRVTQSHAKFVVVRNERWNLAIRTSMNLNENPRLENIEVSDDPALAGFLVGVMDELFAEVAPGDWSARLTGLSGIAGVDVRQGITCGGIGRRLGYPSAKSLRRD